MLCILSCTTELHQLLVVGLKLKIVKGEDSAAVYSVHAGKAVAQLSFPGEKCDSLKQENDIPD